MNWLYFARTTGGLIRHFGLNCISCYLGNFNLIFLFTFTLISLKSLEDKSLFSLAFLISLFISVKQFTLISATNLEKRKILQKSLHVSLSIVCPAAILLSLYVREKFEASDQNFVIYEQYALSTISESNRFFVFIIF